MARRHPRERHICPPSLRSRTSPDARATRSNRPTEEVNQVAHIGTYALPRNRRSRIGNWVRQKIGRLVGSETSPVGAPWVRGEKVGKGINGAAAAFNKAIGSWNSRLSQSVNRIAEMSGIDELAHIDEVQESIGATAPNDLKEAV